MLTAFTYSRWPRRGRGGVGPAVSVVAEEMEVEDVKEEARKARTLCNFIEIRCNFYLFIFCFFIFLKIFLYNISPSSTVCFSFSGQIIEGPCGKRSQNSSQVIGILLLGYLMSICFLGLLHLCLLPSSSLSGSSLFLFLFLFLSVCLFLLFRTTRMAYGSSQAWGQIGAAAASLHHNHSNTRSEPCLRPIA